MRIGHCNFCSGYELEIRSLLRDKYGKLYHRDDYGQPLLPDAPEDYSNYKRLLYSDRSLIKKHNKPVIKIWEDELQGDILICFECLQERANSLLEKQRQAGYFSVIS